MKHSSLKRAGLSLALSFTMLSAVWAQSYHVGPLEIDHPFVRETVASAKVGGGYAKIVNQGDNSDRLLSVSSPVADHVEIHEMKHENNVMIMQQVKQPLVIAPKGELVLKPGGYHLMFMNIKAPFVSSTKVPATLTFEHAGPIDVEFSVEPMNNRNKAAEHQH